MTMKNNKFWNIKNNDGKSHIDLFGYVGFPKVTQLGFDEDDFLNEFRAIPSENDLEISINSNGGSVFTALSIYSLLQSHKGNITIRVDGASMSAATIITSTPNAKVVMPKGSMMMIHKVSSCVDGNADDMRKAADNLDKIEQNLISIYVMKTGKTEEEIKDKVNAETYFTAEEAVEFGLADEIDNSKTVKNEASGDFVMVNGLEMNACLFKNAPQEFISKQFEINNPKQKENKLMNLEQLKAEYPDLVEAIRNEALNEGVSQERQRIQAIEEIATVGHEELVADAKFTNAITAEQLAVAILKADKQRNETMLKNRILDSGDLSNLTNSANEGLSPNYEQKQKDEAELETVIAAGAKGFNARK